MQSSNRSALKEWATVESALAEGRVVLLIRKGGISERRGDFGVEHREFWLFPTHYHQNPHELTEPFRPLLGTEALERLEGLHPLTQETVRSRFAYRGKPYLHALVLRAYRLPEPRVIPNTLDYEGCISWVELDEAISTEGAVPVLPDEAFARARGEVLRRLGDEAVVRL
jgi:hypothetical protein